MIDRKICIAALACATAACMIATHCTYAEPQVEQDEPQVEQTVEVEQETLYDVPLDADLQKHIVETCEAHHIDPTIVLAMIYRESSYNAEAIGDGGDSYGLMQIQPRWHYERMERLGCTDLLNPYQNVTVGVEIFADQLARYDGDIAKALVAYNQGSFKETVTDYALAVLEVAAELAVKQ